MGHYIAAVNMFVVNMCSVSTAKPFIYTVQQMYAVFHNAGKTCFQWHNLFIKWFIYTKISRPDREIMLCEVLSEYPQAVLPLPWNISISVMSVWLDQHVTNTAVLSVCMSKQKARHFGHNSYPVVYRRLFPRQQSPPYDLCYRTNFIIFLWFIQNLYNDKNIQVWHHV